MLNFKNFFNVKIGDYEGLPMVIIHKSFLVNRNDLS